MTSPVRHNRTVTTNGAATNKTSLDANVDFFSVAGSSRGKNISHVFSKAVNSNFDLAVRTLFWLRDIRGGAGERKQFRDLVQTLDFSDIHKHAFYQKVVELGRWDDLFVFLEMPEHRVEVLQLVIEALESGKHGLLAKWTPRKGDVFNAIRKAMGVDPKTLRKLLVSQSNTVEQLMCAGKFDEIEYSKLPSVASARYQKAFWKRDKDRYESYVNALTKGDPSVKINAGAVYPYDIVKSVKRGIAGAADAQWKALPNYLEGSDANILVVADVSGSMECPAGGSGSKSEVTCLDVCISLAIYAGERLTGPFKDCFITFSNNPVLEVMRGKTLSERYNQLSRASWDMSTNIEKVFDTILASAVKHNVPQAELPTHIVVISDMQFNCVSNARKTVFEQARGKFAAKGYALPNVVFWNVNAKAGQSPVTIHDTGSALVSGFSPSIFKSIVTCKDVTPIDMMLETVTDERYAVPYLTE